MIRRLLTAVGYLLLTQLIFPLQAADWRPDFRPPAFAIRNARIVVGPNQTLEDATIIVRNGLVENLGKSAEMKIAPDTHVIDGKGLVVYPGWIDAYTLNGLAAGVSRSKTGSGRKLATSEFASPFSPPDDRVGITPEFLVSESLELGDAAAEARRKIGFTSQIVAPGGAILTGQGALAATTGHPRREIVIVPKVGLHVNLRAPFEPNPSAPANGPSRGRSGSGSGYPNSMMGVISHLRQNILDALHHREELQHFAKHGGNRVPQDPALITILEAIDGKLPVWWQAETEDEIHRALDLSKEFGFKPVIVGGREAYKCVDRLKNETVPVVLRVNHPAKPKVPTQEEYAKKKPEERIEPLRVVEDKLIQWKKRVATAGVLNKAGVKIALSSDGLQRVDQFAEKLRDLVAEGLSEDALAIVLSQNAAELAGVSDQLGTLEKGKLGHLVALTSSVKETKSKVRLVAADGLVFDLDPPTVFAKKQPTDTEKKDDPKKDQAKSKKDPETSVETVANDAKQVNKKANVDSKDKPEAETEPKKEVAKAEKVPFVDTPVELDSDREIKKRTGGSAFIRNATVVTMGPAGTLEKASILIKDGKIVAVGQDIAMPENILEINAEGLFVMPGMIDTHSHMAIQGGVNEMSLSIVPEVRVADVVDGSDPTIYRALAGGTTTARLLHGSANTIGGQDAIIKLRPGHPGRELILNDSKRPQGVKFALGENVTRIRGRFPDTRMGVEATIERAFQEGKAYAETWKKWEADRLKDAALAGLAPRRDLRLEALAKIVQGDIKIHSHCYRADEILMLLRTADRHNVRVQSLQHVLEGYKVAAEIAAHGASASTFSDWWAYKIEAYDAVPANAAILTEAGVNAVIKSDDWELVRHLNLEAAKSVKYGSMPEDKALAMVTINPARELGLDHRLGSIEVGKDADLAIFDAHPLDTLSQCRLTLVNGEIQFQRGSDLAKALKSKSLGALSRNVNASKKRVLDFKEDPDNRRTRAFVGARVHPVSGPTIKNGVVITEGNLIKTVGGPETAIPNGAEVVNLEGLDLWPGMIDSGSRVGLFEVGSLRETQDVSDSATFQPELVTGTALHPDSEIIPVTRANGVLTVLAQPGGGLIAGQSSLANLAGWVPSQMVIEEKLALHVQVPSYIPPKDASEYAGRQFTHACSCESMATDQDGHNHGPMADDATDESDRQRNDARQKRSKQLEEIAEQFKLALQYAKAKAAAGESGIAQFKKDPRMEALLPYAKGEKAVIFQANHRAEILDALHLAKELKLKAIIGGGQEAWKVADALKKADVPVLIGGVLQLPGETYDPYDAPYANAAKLHKAGVKFAIQSGGGGPDEATAARNLPFEAGTAAAFGLPEAEALRSVTLAPAEILGVSDQLGSITEGKRANLVISRGSIIQATTPVVLLVIDGRVMKPESRHTRLADKYRERLKQVKSGMAPLGVGQK